MSRTANPKEREFRRQQILESAIPLFAKHGFEATTLDAIAAKAHLGKGTLYLYFASKERLFGALIVDEIRRFHNHVEEETRKGKTALEKVERYVEASFLYFDGHSDFLRLYMLQMARTDLLRGRLKQKLRAIWDGRVKSLSRLLRKAEAEGSMVKMDAARTADTLKWLINSQYFQLIRSSRPDYRGAADFVKHFFFYGVLARKE